MKIIAYIYNDYPEKFGIPRQSGLVEAPARIVFEPEYRNPAALQGITGYSHLWLLWQFSEAVRDTWSPTVHPPRLGGNKHMGVFATRSPFRPNPIGLSSVRLLGVEEDSKLGSVLLISGADLMNGTPIYDIKPYLPYTDSHPDAIGGFADAHVEDHVEVVFPEELLMQVPKDKRPAVLALLGQDPRPSYQNDPERIYGVAYGTQNIRFRVADGILTVCEVQEGWTKTPSEPLRKNKL